MIVEAARETEEVVNKCFLAFQYERASPEQPRGIFADSPVKRRSSMLSYAFPCNISCSLKHILASAGAVMPKNQIKQRSLVF